MKSYKKIVGIVAVVVSLIIVTVTFVKVKGINASDKLVLQFAHNQSAGSKIADSIAKVADYVSEEDDTVDIKRKLVGLHQDDIRHNFDGKILQA